MALSTMTAGRQRVTLMLLVLFAYGCFAAQKVIAAQGDFSIFVVAGDRYVDRAALDVPVAVLPQSAGYDGQFVYRLALDPLTTRRTDHGITLDTPSLRAQRIGYPLLAHLVALGSPRLVPAALLFLNLAGLMLLTWMATGIALSCGRPGWHGLIVPLYPGLLLSLSRDTTEIVSTAMAVSAIHGALRGRHWQAGLIACAAVLTRETTLLYLMGFGIVTALRAIGRRRGRWSILAFLLPVATIVVWQVVLIGIWGTTSFAAVGHEDLGLPPMIYFVHAVRGDIGLVLHGPLRFIFVYALLTKILLAGQIMVVALAASKARPIDWRLALPWLAYVALAAVFTEAIWVEPFGYLRIFADLYVTGSLLLLASPSRHLRALILLTVPVWVMAWVYAAKLTAEPVGLTPLIAASR